MQGNTLHLILRSDLNLTFDELKESIALFLYLCLELYLYLEVHLYMYLCICIINFEANLRGRNVRDWSSHNCLLATKSFMWPKEYCCSWTQTNQLDDIMIFILYLYWYLFLYFNLEVYLYVFAPAFLSCNGNLRQCVKTLRLLDASITWMSLFYYWEIQLCIGRETFVSVLKQF